MNSVLDLVSAYNQECRHSDSIRVSEYLQTSKKTHAANNQSNGSHSVVYEILRNLDPILETLPHNEKKHYFTGLITKMCSDIDEKTETCYDSYKFNPRVFKKSLIQSSLQEHQKNRLSSLLYLNEYFKCHFVIVINDIYFESCPKSYPIETLIYEKGLYSFREHDLQQCQKGNWEHIPLLHDVEPCIYQMPLEPIGKYKIEDLKQMCLKNNINLKEGTKNKLKKTLYEELNLHLLTHM